LSNAFLKVCRSLGEYQPGIDPDRAAADQAKARAKAAKAASRAANKDKALAEGGGGEGGGERAEVAGKAAARLARAERAAAAAFAPALECYPNECYADVVSVPHNGLNGLVSVPLECHAYVVSVPGAFLHLCVLAGMPPRAPTLRRVARAPPFCALAWVFAFSHSSYGS
jgi:hypothetical protein